MTKIRTKTTILGPNNDRQDQDYRNFRDFQGFFETDSDSDPDFEGFVWKHVVSKGFSHPNFR